MSTESGLLDQSEKLSHSTLLGADDPAVANVLNQQATEPILFVCDHASNYIPTSLENLGLGSEQLQQHIAWDQGTADLAHALSDRISLRTIMCNYSRLVVDCNRRDYDETIVCPTSDGVVIPGNQNLPESDRLNRINQIYYPYHEYITSALDDLQKPGIAPALISLHSFTPQLKGQDKRPWHVGLLWDKDARLAKHFIDYFATYDDLCVGENLPYSGKDIADYTVDHHGEDRGLACVSIEIRQDLLSSADGVSEWADHIVNVVSTIKQDQNVFTMP